MELSPTGGQHEIDAWRRIQRKGAKMQRGEEYYYDVFLLFFFAPLRLCAFALNSFLKRPGLKNVVDSYNVMSCITYFISRVTLHNTRPSFLTYMPQYNLIPRWYASRKLAIAYKS